MIRPPFLPLVRKCCIYKLCSLPYVLFFFKLFLFCCFFFKHTKTNTQQPPSSYPGRVGLVELVQHHHRGAAVVVNKPPEVGGGAGQRMRRHHEGGGPEEAVGERSVDVVVALSLCGDEEGQGAVGRQDVHAPVFLAVPGHQGDAALLHIQVGSH